MTAKTKDYSKTIKTVIDEAKAKAKIGLDKGAELVGEASDFTKGNAEAIVESGKIFAAGMKDFGMTCVGEAKAAAAATNADLKELTSVKTPADFVKLQGEIARRNFETALAFGSQSSEVLLKVAGEAYAPISSRLSLAMEKIKKVA